MKFIKWKILFITSIVCLLPILLGLALWENLPDMMAIHFNFNNEPDNFASKGFVVFGMPILMMLLQIFCCFTNDFNSYKHKECKKFERVAKWIIPVTAIVLQTVTLGYGLGWNIDIRKVAVLIVSAIFIIIGNCMTTLDYIKNYKLDAEKARKINRFLGIETVIMGVLMFITIFMPPVASVIWLFLLIPYALIGIIYGIKHGK